MQSLRRVAEMAATSPNRGPCSGRAQDVPCRDGPFRRHQWCRRRGVLLTRTSGRAHPRPLPGGLGVQSESKGLAESASLTPQPKGRLRGFNRHWNQTRKKLNQEPSGACPGSKWLEIQLYQAAVKTGQMTVSPVPATHRSAGARHHGILQGVQHLEMRQRPDC